MSLDPERLVEITIMSLYVSGCATILGSAIGIPLGAVIGLREFAGKGAIKTLTYTFYGFPPVIAGLVIYGLFSNAGIFGSLDLLFTPSVMIFAEMLLVIPLTAGITITTVSEVDKSTKDTIKALGANRTQATLTIMRESWVGLVMAAMMGFGRCIAEVGAAYMVGGNIVGETEVLTTAIMFQTHLGNFELALALGVVLLSVSFCVYLFLRLLQEKEML